MRLNFRLSFEEKLKKWRTNLARAARHSSLETRTARAPLPARRTPYFAKIAKGLRLGYYRGAVSGSWVASLYRGTKGYETQAIGAADDTTDADAVAVFDFWQAQDQARKWAERQRLIAAGVIRSGPYKVADAVRDYLAEIAAEKKPMAVHGAQGAANRILSMLKTALNRAFYADRVSSDSACRKVKPFKRVDEAVVRNLNIPEIRRLVNACPVDFRKLIEASLYTGCRYAELSRLKYEDYTDDSATLSVRLSKAKPGMSC
jgi:integrase